MLSVKLTNLIPKKILVCTYMKKSKAALYCSKNKVQTTDKQNPVENCAMSGSAKKWKSEHDRLIHVSIYPYTNVY